MEKIVITGMGTVNPLGLNVTDTWKNIITGFRALHRSPASTHQAGKRKSHVK